MLVPGSLPAGSACGKILEIDLFISYGDSYLKNMYFMEATRKFLFSEIQKTSTHFSEILERGCDSMLQLLLKTYIGFLHESSLLLCWNPEQHCILEHGLEVKALAQELQDLGTAPISTFHRQVTLDKIITVSKSFGFLTCKSRMLMAVLLSYLPSYAFKSQRMQSLSKC